MNLEGKTGVFHNHEGTAWEHYSGKECTVLAYDDEESKTGLIVVFKDGQKLAIQIEEFTELIN